MMAENDLIGCTDAREWARQFVDLVKEKPSIATDEGTMIGWFACALGSEQVARDSAAAREWLKEYENGRA
jgi:hypothetical protein